MPQHRARKPFHVLHFAHLKELAQVALLFGAARVHQVPLVAVAALLAAGVLLGIALDELEAHHATSAGA